MDHLQNIFIFRRDFTFKTLGSQQALLTTTDDIARQQLLIAGSVFIKGVKVCLALWNAEFYTFRADWLSRKKYWVNVLRLPHHLWSTANASILAEEVRADLKEVDRRCLDFANIKTFKIKVRKCGPVRSCDFLAIYDGEFEYTVVVLPAITEDLNWNAQHEMGWVGIEPHHLEEGEAQEEEQTGEVSVGKF